MGEPDTKSALIESAVKIFLNKGYRSTRVSDIVSDAGVAQGTFYNYFRSKDAVFHEICNDFISRLNMLFVKRAKHMLDGNTTDEIAENIHAVIRDVFTLYRQNASSAEILFREGTGAGGLFKEIYEGMQAVFLGLIEEQIEKAVFRGFLRVRDAKIVSVFLFGLFERSLLYFTVIRPGADMEWISGLLVDFILNALSFSDNSHPVMPHDIPNNFQNPAVLPWRVPEIPHLSVRAGAAREDRLKSSAR